MKPLPIRLRLTVWYFTVFATAGLLLSLTSWCMLRRTIDATIHQDLQERLDDIRVQLHQAGPSAHNEEIESRFDTVYRYRDDGKWLQILDESGQPLYRSARMNSLALSVVVRRSSADSVIDVMQGSRPIRFLVANVSVDGRSYAVATGISMNKPHALLRDFGLSLVLLTPVVLLMAAAGGHLMSRKALAPVALIAQEARRITDKALDTRLPVPPGDDELSHLSITLNQMLARIDVAFRSVRDFTANASHELRTPLARLRTEVEIALFRPREAAEYRIALERMHEDTVEMSGLVENLLTLARAEAGGETLQMLPIDLRDLLQSVVDEWSPIAHGLSLRLQMAGFAPHTTAQPVYVLGDRLSLIRLLRIWLDNACKFTPAGGIITLRALPKEHEVQLAVEDTGVGIAKEHLGRIFERFYRVHGDAGRHVAGAGLGLSLAAWIAEQHRTLITVTSVPGRGTSFRMKLRRTHAQVRKISDAPSPYETRQEPLSK
jgi:heavy metal sensor kinase